MSDIPIDLIAEGCRLWRRHRIKGGIEFDPLGRRTAYWMFRSHPGAALQDRAMNDLVRVPAGQVSHMFQPLRPGQSRGRPWLSWVLAKLGDIDEYDGAEVVRKKTSAMFTAFVTSNSPQDFDGSLMGKLNQDRDGPLAELSPGTVQFLLPGEDIKLAAPKDGGSYEQFMRSQLRAIAAGMGVSYEQLSGDLSGVNYSSVRAGLLEFRRRVSMLQHQIVIQQFCRPIYREWLKTTILTHFSKDYAQQPDFTLWARARWMPLAWDWVDPEKDVKASVLAIQHGLTSRARVVAEAGEDVEAIDAEQRADLERAQKLNLPYGGAEVA